MKRPTKRSLVLAALIFTSLASGVAAWFWRAHRRTLVARAPLRVLCAEGDVAPGVIDDFAREHDVRVSLYTYGDDAEFLRQLANADGRVDVMCTSSLLLAGLVRSHWVRGGPYADLSQRHGISADFLHLPYDPTLTYAVPTYWTAFGFLSARGKVEGNLKALQARGRVGAWASDLNLMALLTVAGVEFADRLESEGVKRLEDDVLRFVTSLGLIPPDPALAQPAEWLKRYDFAHVPASTLTDLGQFAPGEGGVVDVGVLALGERATSPELGLALIERLSTPEVAMATALRRKVGTVHVAGDADPRFGPTTRAAALRALELTKLKFPDVNAEALLKFARTFANARGARR